MEIIRKKQPGPSLTKASKSFEVLSLKEHKDQDSQTDPVLVTSKNVQSDY